VNFAQFVAILKARWWVALAVLLLAVVSALGVSLMLPKQYTATASVVVDMKPDPIAAVIYQGMMTPAYMATQVDVLESDRVALRVVRNLKLAENPQVRAQWQESTDGKGTIENWLIQTFKASMNVKPSRESNVISVSYRSADPRFAAALANAFVQAYVDTTLELRVDPAKQYSTFFDVRSKALRDNLEKAQARLSDFQREKGIIAADERFDVENFRLNELSSQLVGLQGLSAEATSRQANAGNNMQEVLNNPMIASLKLDLSRNEARLKELSSRLGDSHPQVVEAKANLNELRSRIDTETKRVVGGAGVTSSVTRQREAQIRTELEQQRQKVLKMKQLRDEGAVLVRDVENAQRAYDAVLARLNQTSLESETTQSNVNMLTQASPPAEPSSPKVGLNTLLAVLVGSMLGLGATLALEMMDRRVRVGEDVHASLGLPLLGTLPKPSAKRKVGARLPMMQQRLLTSGASGTARGE
jgi:chain length determinant protein EpsF